MTLRDFLETFQDYEAVPILIYGTKSGESEFTDFYQCEDISETYEDLKNNEKMLDSEIKGIYKTYEQYEISIQYKG